MSIEIEFLRCDSAECVAKVTIRPSWLRRLFGARDAVWFAVRDLYGWHWDHTGDWIWREPGNHKVEAALKSAYYWRYEHPRVVALVEAQRRVNPDGTLRPKPS